MILSASMMCANFDNLEKTIKELEKANLDYLHLDIMDGAFVHNFGMGMQDLESIKRLSSLPTDAHLMIKNPGQYVDLFTKLGMDIIYVHYESETDIPRTLEEIRKGGSHPGLAISPGTSFESVKECLNLCDYVLIMTVNPGFAGQKFLDFVVPKIEQFAQNKEKYGYKIMIDGACSNEVIKRLEPLGVDGFVLGTSALFKSNLSFDEAVKKIRG